MTADLEFDTTELREYIEDWDRALPVVLEEFQKAMTESLLILEQNIVGRTPVNTGFLRQSIGHTMWGEPAAIYGDIRSVASYGAPVEFGRAPGRWPPREAIEYWVRRKLGITNDKEAASVAFLIQRHIGTKGTKPAHMFTDGFAASEGEIEKAVERAMDRIIFRMT